MTKLLAFPRLFASDLCSGEAACAQIRARCKWALRLSVVLTLCCVAATAEFNVQTWTTENGLPQNIVMDTCQAPDGYLWLATLNGLVRFDGVRFTVFDHSGTAGIPGNQFNSVYCSPSGEVWAGTGATGLIHYSGGAFENYSTQKGLPAEAETRVTGDDAGHVWAFTGRHLAQWNPDLLQFVPAPGLQGNWSGNSDASGSFQSVSGGEVKIFSKGKLIRYTLPAGPEWQAPRMVGRDLNGTVWICDLQSRLRYLQQGSTRWSEPILPSPANRASRTFLYRNPRGDAWTLVVNYRFGGNLEQTLSVPSGGQTVDLPVNSIFHDGDGTLWVASNGHGLSRIRQQNVNMLTTEDGLPDGNVYPIFQDHTGDIWIGSGGLARYHQGRVVPFSSSGGLQSKRITSIGEDRAGGLWVAAYGGLFRGMDGRFEQVHQAMLTDGTAIQAIYQDPEGPLWFGTHGALVRLQEGQWTSFHREDGLAGGDVRVILRGRAGELWIGGYGGLTRLANGQYQRWTEAEGLPSNSVRALYEDKEGVLWIGTYDGGLARLQDGHLTRYGVRDGLFANGVFQILEDDRGYFWMSSNRGIFRVAKRELDLFARGALKVVTSVHYGKGDGMRNDECNGGYSPAGIRTADGKLWFPTQDGVAILDTSSVSPDRRTPSVVIESLAVDHLLRPVDRAARITPEQDDIEIAYTAPSLTDPDSIQFRYRMVGLDRDWVDASTRRTAYYTHMPAGEYDFEVLAASSAGAWNGRGAKVHLSVLPHFYRTRWFAWLVMLVCGSMLALLWRLRTLRFERAAARQRALSGQLIASQEGERKRIAAELHDSLGQHLLLIKNWAAQAAREVGDGAGRQSVLEISDAASQAIQEAREISYNLRPLQLERLGLTTAIKDLVQQVAAASVIDFRARVDNVDGDFAPDAEMSIYRICQEGLSNIVRHSGATEATIQINREKDRVDIVIGDNGRGFERADIGVQEPGMGGFGMLGMTERVKMLGGRMSVTSSPGSGGVIRVSIRLPQGTR